MRVGLFSFLVLVPSLGQAQAPITKRNWQNHPSIVAIRTLVTTIDRDSGSYTATRDSAECHGGEVRLEEVLLADSLGRPRKYRVSGGSGDSAGEATYYYDTEGHLRFVFTETGAVNGTQREDRAYYSPLAALVYSDSRLIKGPGYPGGFEPDPVFDPKATMGHLCDPRQSQ